jgi:hypothetical protein
MFKKNKQAYDEIILLILKTFSHGKKCVIIHVCS